MFYTAKIQNWKQFTTGLFNHLSSFSLCFTLQRYKIESNSQRFIMFTNLECCCVLHCKDTKLKAIHNTSPQEVTISLVVFYTAKIQNWKQFTTIIHLFIINQRLCFTLQRYKIESNSQRFLGYWPCTSCCVLHCKDTKLKAIHNSFVFHKQSMLVVFYTAKIQNWKQFTTLWSQNVRYAPLCFTLQRYKIESNSQQ